MIEALFQLIFNIFFWLVSLIGSLIIYPVQAILVTIFPALGSALTYITTLFIEHIFPMLSFVKEFIIEITCIPRSIFYAFLTFIFARWAIAPAIRGIKLLINIWKIKSGGATK